MNIFGPDGKAFFDLQVNLLRTLVRHLIFYQINQQSEFKLFIILIFYQILNLISVVLRFY
jgi:hypothetical protein